ncbi:CopC domain-containing protein YobA [[Enterobacter] lignolyticus]|uniref:Copper resistance protein C n=1 Tax=[Enterobacter] lignolyticus TaxID=1334193 RepID=A0A806X5N0_9ENTR|nr:CopC domain-containing protein YobA [[Enterobacter] lignolyticus]ALR77074.1 hypothetical protein AO703_12435 [[Enterobacter] lignolyticus]
MGLIASRALRGIVFFACTVAASSAFAHAHLQQQSPAADTEISAAPQALTLRFSEGIEGKFSGVTLTGPQHEAIPTGLAAVSEKDDKQLVVPLTQALKSGSYTVNWHVVSVDGHKTQGQYHFSVK